MEEVRYYFDQERAKRFLIGAGLLLISAVSLKMYARHDSVLLLGQGSFVGSLLFFLAMLLFILNYYPFVSKKPALILSDGGITDNTGSHGQGFIPWSRVVAYKSLGKGIINIRLMPKDSQRVPRIWDSYYVSVPKQESIDINCQALGSSEVEIVSRIRAFLTAAHAARTPE